MTTKPRFEDRSQLPADGPVTVTEFVTAARFEHAGKAVIEWDGLGWLICHTNGDVESARTAAQALRRVERRAKRVVEVTRTADVLVTTVEWRNAPEGFVPPEGGRR